MDVGPSLDGKIKRVLRIDLMWIPHHARGSTELADWSRDAKPRELQGAIVAALRAFGTMRFADAVAGVDWRRDADWRVDSRGKEFCRAVGEYPKHGDWVRIQVIAPARIAQQ